MNHPLLGLDFCFVKHGHPHPASRLGICETQMRERLQAVGKNEGLSVCPHDRSIALPSNAHPQASLLPCVSWVARCPVGRGRLKATEPWTRVLSLPLCGCAIFTSAPRSFLFKTEALLDYWAAKGTVLSVQGLQVTLLLSLASEPSWPFEKERA